MGKIAIWMGHSGSEPGASGLLFEDNVTLQARQWAVAYARACGHTVTTDNNDMSLTQRINASNSSHLGIMEFHANLLGNGQAHGTEVWYSQYSTGKGQKLASSIAAIGPKYGFTNRGAKNSKDNRYGRLGILDTPSPTAVLVELFFLDNASDVANWNAHGKALVEDMTAAFLAGLGLNSKTSGNAPDSPSKPSLKPLGTIAQEVINGLWGSGNDRKNRLSAAGYDYNTVQAEVNRILGASSSPSKSIGQVAQEVINGSWGNNPSRATKLKAAGYNPTAVQNEVNRLLGAGSNKKSISQIAQEVINGNWGNNPQRAAKLKAAGYDPNAVQKEVNRLLK